MNKIELAKMIGLVTTGYTQQITKHDIENLLENEWMTISETFSGNIEIEIEQEDLAADCLDIKLIDLEREDDAKVCIRQIEDLLWERAADEYLELVHEAAMFIGGR